MLASAVVAVGWWDTSREWILSEPDLQPLLDVLDRLPAAYCTALWTTTGAAAVLVARAASPRTRGEWRVAQAVGWAGCLLVPVVLPFAVWHAFGTLRRFAAAEQRDRRLRPFALAGGVSLVAYGAGLLAVSSVPLNETLIDVWPDGVASWYFTSWPETLRLDTLAAQRPWTAVPAVVFGAVAVALALRTYQHRAVAERRVLQLATPVGALALVAALPVLLTAVAYAVYGVVIVALGIALGVFVVYVLLSAAGG